MKEEKSKCCKAIKEAIYSDEGTGYYACSKCKSEFIPQPPESKSERKCDGCKLFSTMGVHSFTCPIRQQPIHITVSESLEEKDWSQCNPCFDGEHSECVSEKCECKCKARISHPPADSNLDEEYEKLKKNCIGHYDLTLPPEVKSFIEKTIQQERQKAINEFVEYVTTPTCMEDTGVCTNKVTYDGIKHYAQKFLAILKGNNKEL